MLIKNIPNLSIPHPAPALASNLNSGRGLPLKFSGLGMYVPPNVQCASEIATLTGRKTSWIVDQVGVAERRVADEEIDTMAAKAAREALGDERTPDLLINASSSSIQLIPDTSVFFSKSLGFEGIPSFSVNSTCLSFVVALSIAASHLTAGMYKRILIISSERATLARNFNEPESAALLGDAAAAAVLELPIDEDASRLLAFEMGTWPSGSGYTEVRAGGQRRHPNFPEYRKEDALFRMDGKRIYKAATKIIPPLVERALEKAKLKISDIDLVVPHQASGPALAAISSFFALPPDRIVNIISSYGNCVAASIPQALYIAQSQGRLKRGSRVMLLGTGAGLSAACAILTY